MTEAPPVPRKGSYRLGEVARLAGVPGHVLRYWESEFPMLRPRKTSGGQRRYSAADVDVVLRIKDLVHGQGFTIAGARRQLLGDPAGTGVDGEDPMRECLREVEHEIRSILTLLEADDTL